MEIRHLLYMAGLLTTLAACTADDQPTVQLQERMPVSLSYQTLQAVDTRALSSTILNDQNIASGRGVMVKIANVGTTEWADYTYTTGDDGVMTAPASSDAPLYPADDTHIKILAYHPADADELFNVQTDQTTDANYQASDLMFSNNVTDQEKQVAAVPLTFVHKMAKIVVNVTAGTGVTSIASATLKQVVPTVTFDQSDGTVTTSTTAAKTDITVIADGTKGQVSGAALIPDQIISGALLEIVTDQGKATYTVSSKHFKSGHKYTLNLTVNRTAVGTTNAITSWVNAGAEDQDQAFLPLQFTINENGTKVKFSPGNLQATYDGTSWTWAFAENQWDYIGSAAGNTKVTATAPFISENATVDLFGWVGNSSKWTGVAQYGITSSTVNNSTDGYGNVGSDGLKRHWGNNTIINGNGYTWRPLTSDEWTYLFNSRTSGSTVNRIKNARYTMATINVESAEVNGIILFPDGVTIDSCEVAAWGDINKASQWCTQCTSAQWKALTAKGCVFLPAAGYRSGATVSLAGHYAHYWSSSSYNGAYSYGYYAQSVYFGPNSLSLAYNNYRYYGCSVRLVRQVQ